MACFIKDDVDVLLRVGGEEGEQDAKFGHSVERTTGVTADAAS